jgi:hypothetical protein
VVWLDHVARTHEPQSDRMVQECIFTHSLITEIWKTMIKYRTIDAINLVVIMKPAR